MEGTKKVVQGAGARDVSHGSLWLAITQGCHCPVCLGLPGFICYLVESFTVCSPIPTFDVVHAFIFIFGEDLIWGGVSGKGARPAIYLTTLGYIHSPSLLPGFTKSQTQGPSSLAMSRYVFSLPLSL